MATDALTAMPMAQRQRWTRPATKAGQARCCKAQRPLLLGGCLLAALALHVALFGLVAGSDHHGAGGTQSTRGAFTPSSRPRAVQVVLLPSDLGDSRQDMTVAPAQEQAGTPPSAIDTAPTNATSVASAGTTVIGTLPAMAPPVDDASASYLPRRLLTRKAEPLAEVRIDYPPGTPLGEFSAELLLFIDETGHVQLVRSRSNTLPHGLEAAARQAFHAVQFRPGEVDGQPVRSLYPVQVNFSVDAGARNASQP